MRGEIAYTVIVIPNSESVTRAARLRLLCPTAAILPVLGSPYQVATVTKDNEATRTPCTRSRPCAGRRLGHRR
jgi:hypothetical protein